MADRPHFGARKTLTSRVAGACAGGICWPGMIKPATISNEVYSHTDMLPTMGTVAGKPQSAEISPAHGFHGFGQTAPCFHCLLTIALRSNWEHPSGSSRIKSNLGPDGGAFAYTVTTTEL